MYIINEHININELSGDGHNMHQDHNACGSLTCIMSTQKASKWSMKTAKLNSVGTKRTKPRFDNSTIVTNTFDEVAIFVMGGGGFNVENGHEIASSPNCGRRFSVQIIVNLEKLPNNLHKIDEEKYLAVKDYSRRLALENQAIDMLSQHHG